MKLRRFQTTDAEALRELFNETVRHVNKRDYTAAQIAAWAPDGYDREAWLERLQRNQPYIAEIDGSIVGFADVQADGYIDHFFCSASSQGQGVGRALMSKLLAHNYPRFYANVSITARPFFEHFGFRLVREQQVIVRGETLTNYLMEKLTHAGE
ncbi:GNAT family N-acetyltransferase [Pseudidiomarina homiensis]|uniref:GNAT family N-acetyltransferase n=1 Tax=Pseudidiomarina homiensis TaxID=364198 RepID=A0A432Y7J9_9GAMM|nr:GNAT family N-acetyltransferase [Pseudidiomarina homiensis]RUO56917.1 GNAT family N-acetyltransferase [Pseudidiomarina homiensis]